MSCMHGYDIHPQGTFVHNSPPEVKRGLVWWEEKHHELHCMVMTYIHAQGTFVHNSPSEVKRGLVGWEEKHHKLL